MKVLVTGSRGFIGSALVTFLRENRHSVFRLVRGGSSREETDLCWDPASGILDPDMLEGMACVVHLAGENLASGRWTREKKQRILTSRVDGTKLLSRTLAGLDTPPEVLVSASAIGYYGDRGDQVLSEDDPPGTGFLADVCRQWEEAASPAKDRGIRVVFLRTGIVLSPAGGALARMLLPFRLGLGGKMGHGRQYWSWIALDDLVRVIYHIASNRQLRGAVNAVAPSASTCREFCALLGRTLGRPAFFAMPAFLARLVFGEMADEMLLAGSRVTPARLTASGYKFHYPELEPALRAMLQSGAAG